MHAGELEEIKLARFLDRRRGYVDSITQIASAFNAAVNIR